MLLDWYFRISPALIIICLRGIFHTWPIPCIKRKSTDKFLQSGRYPITLPSGLLAALNREHYSPHHGMHLCTCGVNAMYELHIFASKILVKHRVMHTCGVYEMYKTPSILLNSAMQTSDVVFTNCTSWDAKAPSDPDFLPRPIEFLGFCGVSRSRERKGRIREVPRPFLPASFTLIGMASYVTVRVKIVRIWWILVRNWIP